MLALANLPLEPATSREWVDCVLANFDDFLLDHAACERKASAMAMSFVVKYPDHPKMLEPMIAVAREELAHYHEVFRMIQRRNIPLKPDEKDPYVKGLQKHTRHSRAEHLLDKLMIAAVIEARGCERFHIIAQHLPTEELRRYYDKLAREEAGHYTVFLKMAKMYYDSEAVDMRLQDFIAIEQEVIKSIPIRPAVH